MRLYLREKPSQGRDIAKVLGAKRQVEDGLIGPEITVTWCIGHLREAAPPEAYGEQYKQWSLEQLPIIPSQRKLEVKPKTAKQLSVVQHLLGEADAVVIATDTDREGEMIAHEIRERCHHHGPVQRMWLSTLNEDSIRKALVTLKPGAETLPLYYLLRPTRPVQIYKPHSTLMQLATILCPSRSRTYAA